MEHVTATNQRKVRLCSIIPNKTEFSDFNTVESIYTCCGNFSYYHMHGSCTQYQKQLQEVEEKNAAAQEMQKKLEAELNEVS